jgi:hypothetical protein
MRSKWALGWAMCSMLTGGSVVASANLITNPGFESGTTGWTFAGSSGVTGAPHTGSDSGYVNCVPCGAPGYSGSVSQTISTNIGDAYSIDFFVADNNLAVFGTGGGVSVAFGNTIGFSTTTNIAGNLTWVEENFTGTATSATTTFSFASQAMIGGTYFIDDITVNDLGPAAPEPSTLLTTAGVLLAAVFLRKHRAASHA